MKRMIFLMLALLIVSVASMNAQVTIGGTTDPHAGAVLDLSPSNKGLLLPSVYLDDDSSFTLADENTASTATGMLVYNLNPDLAGGKGVYVWNGDVLKWVYIGPPVLISDITLATSPVADVTNVNSGSTLQLVATVAPAKAANQTLIWSISASTGSANQSSVSQSGLVSAVGGGSIIVQATAADGSGIAQTYALTVVGEHLATIGNNTYKVYTYPNNLGTWMVENSKEGTPSFTTYTGHSEGERGYYYSAEKSAGACPAGWSLPTTTQALALVDHLNGEGTANRDEYWLTSSAWAGYYSDSRYPDFYCWDDQGYWWCEDGNNEISSMYDRDYVNVGGAGADAFSTVRCIQD
jgi:uncharacterized protein (TIGR02145 family)